MKDDIVREALVAAGRLGAADAEIVLSRHVAFDVEVAKGEVETLALAEAIGAGVRLFTTDRRMGFAYATDLSSGPTRLIEAAWHNALANDPDEHNVLLESTATSEEDWTEEDFAGIPVAQKVDFARQLEEKTLGADPRITQVQQAGYGDVLFETTVANSRGLLRRFRNAHCSCSVVAIAEQGGEQEMDWQFDFGPRFGALRLDWVAASCAERVLQRLGAAPCATRAMPIVLDNHVATQFIQVIASSFMADNVLKGKSMYAGRIGERIASDCVTFIDRNDADGGLYRAPFDAEGASAQETAVVESGMLRSFLHNAYTAHRMNAQTTANAGRSGFRSAPEVGVTNAFLRPGAYTQEQLFDLAGEGFFVTDAMGVHTADPISGDFSFGAAGRAIENGRLSRPIRGVTIAGNIKDVLMNVLAVGSDLRFFGACGGPSVLVAQLMVSGE